MITVQSFSLTDLRKVIADTLELPITEVVRENEAHSVANSAFITAGVSFEDTLSYGDSKWDPVNETMVYSTDWEVTVDINAYGKNSQAILKKLISCMRQVHTTKLALRKINLGFVSHTAIRDLSAMALPTWEERAHVSINLWCTHKIQSNQKRIDIVRVAISDEMQRVDIEV